MPGTSSAFQSGACLLPQTSSQGGILFALLKTRPAGPRAVKRRPNKALCQRRHIQTNRHVSTSANASHKEYDYQEPTPTQQKTALSCLPWLTLLRSYMITSISSSTILLKPSLAAMTFLAHTKTRLFNPDYNRLLHALLKRTFYVQFCAGEQAAEVRETIKGLKAMGYKGVILGHAREVVLSKEDEERLQTSVKSTEQEQLDLEDIKNWKDATIETIELTSEGDFVALKFTGAGGQALQNLKETTPCAPAMRDAIHEMCKLAQSRGVRLLFDAEQVSLQQGIDNWTLYYMRHYNKNGKALVHGTYQAYAKRTPGLLSQHLAAASQEDFTVGVKLVRGAYLGSDPRETFWDTIEGTHECYNNIAKCCLEKKYGGMLKPVSDEAGRMFPNVALVLASHNAESIEAAREIRDRQAREGSPRIDLSYGTLQGMADHLSTKLVQESNERQQIGSKGAEIPQAFKYLVWGTMGECMKYLLRRAHENKDAVSRTATARKALGREIAVRLGLARA